MSVVFVGPAGSGKTILTHKYSSWLKRELFLRTAIVNLDPGAENVLYEPTFDIREMFTLRDVMVKYNLGPNGAFVKASELIAENVDFIFSRRPFSDISSWDVILVDTPGQMEAFVFRDSSGAFLNRLKRASRPIVVYVIDASAIETLIDALTMWFIHVLIGMKTGLPTIPVVNKVDLAKRLDIVSRVVESPEKLIEGASESVSGLYRDIVPDLVSVAIKTKAPLRTVAISAIKQEDYSELHSIVHEAHCTCGDLT